MKVKDDDATIDLHDPDRITQALHGQLYCSPYNVDVVLEDVETIMDESNQQSFQWMNGRRARISFTKICLTRIKDLPWSSHPHHIVILEWKHTPTSQYFKVRTLIVLEAPPYFCKPLTAGYVAATVFLQKNGPHVSVSP